MFGVTFDKASLTAFVKAVTEPNNYEESCAWLYIDSPFDEGHTIYIYPVKNVGLPGRSPRDTFAPDKKDFQRVKKETTKRCLTKIGNIHTHLILPQDLARNLSHAKKLGLLGSWNLLQSLWMDGYALPSGTDLKFASKFNDVIRGIITVMYADDNSQGVVARIVFHDKYGKILFSGRDFLYPLNVR